MVFNADTMTDQELIKYYGGPAKLAELLGLKEGGVQRVNNWRSRGIPPKEKLARPDIFLFDLSKKKTNRTHPTEQQKRETEPIGARLPPKGVA